MKKFLLFLLLFVDILIASTQEGTYKKLPLETSLPLLSSIKSKAIELGNGKSDIYVFVDPFCPHSQNFFEMIFNSKKMQSKYHYYLFLYELKRMNSHDAIRYIYSSRDKLQKLKEIMINHNKNIILTPQKDNVQLLISEINSIAKQLNIYKRPYLIINKKKGNK